MVSVIISTSVGRTHCICTVRHIIVRRFDHFRSYVVALTAGRVVIVVCVRDWVCIHPGCSQVPRIVCVGFDYLVPVFVLSVFQYLDVTPMVWPDDMTHDFAVSLVVSDVLVVF